jgi:hypothetical protein
MSFSRRVLHMDFCPRFASDQPADATGYPLRHRGLRQRHRGDATHGRRRADTVATTHQLSGGCLKLPSTPGTVYMACFSEFALVIRTYLTLNHGCAPSAESTMPVACICGRCGSSVIDRADC